MDSSGFRYRGEVVPGERARPTNHIRSPCNVLIFAKRPFGKPAIGLGPAWRKLRTGTKPLSHSQHHPSSARERAAAVAGNHVVDDGDVTLAPGDRYGEVAGDGSDMI